MKDMDIFGYGSISDSSSEESDSGSDCSDAESEDGFDYEMCAGGSCSRGNGGKSRNGGVLPFNPCAIENIILKLFEKFNFRVLMEEKSRNAVLVTAGLTIAGGIFGANIGGKLGAAVGGAVGGACGVGVVAICMKDAWEQLKFQLSELVELVYDYMAGLELKDYTTAASVILSNGDVSTQLASMLLTQASTALGKNVIATITES